METQQTRQRATQLTFYVATKENLQRNRTGSVVEHPRHKKTFTEAYNVLTPTQSPTEEKKSLFPEYLERVPQIRTPRGSIVTQKKVVKKQKSACMACVIQ